MKKIAILVIALLMSGAILTQDLQGAEENNPAEKVKSLRHEISLINLVNGLNLTEAQLDQLISILKEVRFLREDCQEKIKTLSADEVTECDKIRTILVERGPQIDPKEGGKAGKLKEDKEKIQEELQAKLPDYEKKIDAILTEAQKQVIDTFKQCLIPIPSLRTPVRVGQSGNNEKAMAVLRMIRNTPDKAYEKKRNHILDQQFKRFEEKYGKLTEDEISSEQKRLVELMDKAREMSAKEFELNKEELATQFEIKNRTKELSEELKSLNAYRNKDKPKLNKIGHYFLDPYMLGVLETKLVNLKNFKPLPSKDLGMD